MKNLIAFLSLTFIIGFVIVAESAPRKYPDVTKTSRNDGDTITPIGVSCSSTTWTELLPVNAIRRVAKLTTLTGTDLVCISTDTSTANCIASTKGVRLIAAVPYEHASEAALRCRVIDTKAAVVVYGIDYKDGDDSVSYP